MTIVDKTVTQELRDAIAAIEDTTTENALVVARAAIERALDIIQHARCQATAALDRF